MSRSPKTGLRPCPTEARDPARIDPAFVAFAERLADGAEKWPLYLHGTVGSGKTSAALWMLDQWGPNGFNGRTETVIADWYAGFIRARSLPTLIQADEAKFHCYRHGEAWQVTKASLERTIQTASLIVLDDFAVAERPSDWHLDRVMEILDWRAGHFAKPLVITGNLTPADLLKTSWGRGRVADRMLRGSRFGMNGASRRTGVRA